MWKKSQNFNYYNTKNKLLSKFFIIMIVLNVIPIINIPSENITCGSFTGDDANPPSTGNWIVDSSDNIVTNETIVLNGNLRINNGGSLIFKNVTLLMNCTFNGTYNINVLDGGLFHIMDYDNNPNTKSDSSIITSATPDGRHRFYLHVLDGAEFNMKNSELHECGYETAEPFQHWTRGLCIETGNTVIENCLISHNYYGVMLYYFSNNSVIVNTDIIFNDGEGIHIEGKNVFTYMENIIVENCTIASNANRGSYPGLEFLFTSNSRITNCNIYHHQRSGISFGGSKNVNIDSCNVINNLYGFSISGGISNCNISNNTIVGNLDHAIYNWEGDYIDAQYNYFGTNDQSQIKAQVIGNVNYSNWLDYRESEILHINDSKEWKNTIKNLNNGLIINGNLTISNTTLIMNNSLGNNFIQVNGKLNIENSIIKINETKPELISIWGVYAFQYSSTSAGYIKNSEIQDYKGIRTRNKWMNISNTTFGGKLCKQPLFGLLISGENTIIEYCNISNSTSGIEINSKNNIITNCNISFNGWGIKLCGNKNTVSNNLVINNYFGIELNGGSNIITNSNISNNSNGVIIFTGFNNTIENCNIAFNNDVGIGIYRFIGGQGKNNKIYHNNFISNGKNASSPDQAFDQGSNNKWDDGYPNGGNYWNDYTGIDIYSGEKQNISGSDGIGDVPYNIPDRSAKDRYPWLYPNGQVYHLSAPILNSIILPTSDGNYNLTWNPVPNAVNYTLYEHEPSQELKEIATGNSTFMNFTGKENGTYYYNVQAVNDKCVSELSNMISIIVDYPPNIPRNLIVTPIVEGNTLNISWVTNEIDTINYSIWSNCTEIWKPLINITHPNCSYVHNNLTDGTRYFYKIQAWDRRNQSSKVSKIVIGIPFDSVPPSTPKDLKVYTLSNNSIELHWEPNLETDLTGYDIFRRESSEEGYLKINNESVLSNSYCDTNLKSNTTYYYKIKAYDEVPNYSDFSNIAFNTTLITLPEIVSYSPIGTDIPLDTNISITFNKPMNRISVEEAILIKPFTDGNYCWSDDLQKITLIPNDYLIENEIYNITILVGAVDLENISLLSPFSWEFITSNIPLPKIISYFPVGNFVPIDTNISVTFNTKMDKQSVESAFSIGIKINGTFHWTNDNLTIIFNPEERLLELTQYFITINNSAQDLFGKPIISTFSWNFSTGDFTAPKIISYSPVGKNVQISTVITIIFNESMNETSVIESFSITNNINGEFHWRNNTLIFQPSLNLSYSTTYKVTITTHAEDIWGNHLFENLSWEFATEQKSDQESKVPTMNVVLYVGISCIILISIIVIFIWLRVKKSKLSVKESLNEKNKNEEEIDSKQLPSINKSNSKVGVPQRSSTQEAIQKTSKD